MRDPSPELAQSSLPAGDMLLWDPPWSSPWPSPYSIRSRLAAANPFDRCRRGGSESLTQFLLSSSFKDRAQPTGGGWTGIRGRRRPTSRPRLCASRQRKGKNSVLGVGRPGSRMLSRRLRVFSNCLCSLSLSFLTCKMGLLSGRCAWCVQSRNPWLTSSLQEPPGQEGLWLRPSHWPFQGQLCALQKERGAGPRQAAAVVSTTWFFQTEPLLL